MEALLIGHGERGDNVVCTCTSLPPTRWTEKRLGLVLVADSVLAESVKKSAAWHHYAPRSSVSPMMSNVSSSYRRRARKELDNIMVASFLTPSTYRYRKSCNYQPTAVLTLNGNSVTLLAKDEICDALFNINSVTPPSPHQLASVVNRDEVCTALELLCS